MWATWKLSALKQLAVSLVWVQTCWGWTKRIPVVASVWSLSEAFSFPLYCLRSIGYIMQGSRHNYISLIVSLVITCCTRTFAFNTGAPKETCVSMKPGHVGEESGSPPPFRIRVEPAEYRPHQIVLGKLRNQPHRSINLDFFFITWFFLF